jgi:hypothetical protein
MQFAQQIAFAIFAGARLLKRRRETAILTIPGEEREPSAYPGTSRMSINGDLPGLSKCSLGRIGSYQ